MSPLKEYRQSLQRHWAAIMTGSLVVGVYSVLVFAYPDAGSVHHWWNHLPPWLVWLLAVLALTVAQYRAWRDLRAERDAITLQLQEQLRSNRQAATIAEFDMRFGRQSNLSGHRRVELAIVQCEKLEAEIAAGDFTNAWEVLALKEVMLPVLADYYAGGPGYSLWHDRLYFLVDAVSRHESEAASSLKRQLDSQDKKP